MLLGQFEAKCSGANRRGKQCSPCISQTPFDIKQSLLRIILSNNASSVHRALLDECLTAFLEYSIGTDSGQRRKFSHGSKNFAFHHANWKLLQNLLEELAFGVQV